MPRLESAIDQICTARRYTEKLIDGIDPGDWFRQPSEGVTHVAWQVGHLAMAEFRLANQRIRGPQPDDGEFVTEEFLKLFGKGSVPTPEPDRYPSAEEIRTVFDRVHQRTIEELRSLPEKVWDESSEPQHPMFSTKLGALIWTAQHEFSHAGQIGLLRRLFGKEPLWT